MVLKLETNENKNHYISLLSPGIVVEVMNPSVAIGGRGIHSEYHLYVSQLITQIIEDFAMFHPFPYMTLYCHSSCAIQLIVELAYLVCQFLYNRSFYNIQR